ncbi:hypothetical protein H6P81_011503 [Aristolochia fimbriata]|uniref:Uncharacterized protein n=1 Tax=Aristolochia fimbriata TaxID=158543 RepID=A0AAV7ERP7_ARIFI|nr:hypothetical protein H6P81_011503 [Aristolochia fimbriata]
MTGEISEKNNDQFGDCLSGLGLSTFICTSMSLKAAIKLRVFEIIYAAGAGASLTAAEIAAEIPTKNPDAAASLEKILRILASNSLLTVSYEGGDADGKRVYYGLSSWASTLAPHGADGVSSAAHYLLPTNEAMVAAMHRLEDAVLERGAVPFQKVHGETIFEFAERDAGFGKVFHNAMSHASAMAMAKAFEVYDGFEKATEIVDVGGGVGTCLSMIVSKYPHVRGINFDLPYVVADAPKFPGVTHVGGDMFQAIPKTDTIFMKTILHDWNDEMCVKLLRNCWEALPPEGGKVIAVEYVLPPEVGNDTASLVATTHDILVMACCPEAKERTLKEFGHLSKAAGFAWMNNFPVGHGVYVMEFHKFITA